jgi:hypothetical protein
MTMCLIGYSVVPLDGVSSAALTHSRVLATALRMHACLHQWTAAPAQRRPQLFVSSVRAPQHALRRTVSCTWHWPVAMASHSAPPLPFSAFAWFATLVAHCRRFMTAVCMPRQVATALSFLAGRTPDFDLPRCGPPCRRPAVCGTRLPSSTRARRARAC